MIYFDKADIFTVHGFKFGVDTKEHFWGDEDDANTCVEVLKNEMLKLSVGKTADVFATLSDVHPTGDPMFLALNTLFEPSGWRPYEPIKTSGFRRCLRAPKQYSQAVMWIEAAQRKAWTADRIWDGGMDGMPSCPEGLLYGLEANNSFLEYGAAYGYTAPSKYSASVKPIARLYSGSCMGLTY